MGFLFFNPTSSATSCWCTTTGTAGPGCRWRGHRPDGGGVRHGASVAAGGGDRLRIGRAHLRAATATPRLRRHDRRARRAAQRHVEHVAGRLHADTSGLFDNDRRTPAWDAQYNRAADISYRQLQLLAGPHFGVLVARQLLADRTTAPSTAASKHGASQALQARFDIGREGAWSGRASVCDEVRHPDSPEDPHRAARFTSTTLVRDFQLWGGRIVIRKFDTPRELAALREPIVINCTGLGARDLFGDQELVPLKGQLTVMVPQPEVQYHTNGGVPPVPGATLGIHMMVRSDGIALGGTSQRGVWTLEPDEAERKRVVDSHIAVFSAMACAGSRRGRRSKRAGNPLGDRGPEAELVSRPEDRQGKRTEGARHPRHPDARDDRIPGWARRNRCRPTAAWTDRGVRGTACGGAMAHRAHQVERLEAVLSPHGVGAVGGLLHGQPLPRMRVVLASQDVAERLVMNRGPSSHRRRPAWRSDTKLVRVGRWDSRKLAPV